MRRCLLFAMVFLVLAVAARAQTVDTEINKRYLFKWTDDKGIVHITDGLGNVPKKYRDKAEKAEQPEQGNIDQGPPAARKGLLPGSSDEKESSEDQEAGWRQRMKAAKQRLEDVERRYRELDQQRTELLARAPYTQSPPADRAKAEEIDQNMQKVQKEIDDARNEIEVVIPEDARKAGIPPGWLRE
jgi:hypothetical protein